MDCSSPGSSVLGLSRQEYWNGLPCPPPGDPPGLGIEPTSLMSPELADGFFTTSTTWEAHKVHAEFIYITYVCAYFLRCVQLFETLWTGAHKTPLSMEFRQGGCCHFLLKAISPTQWLNNCLLHWQADSLPTVPSGKTYKVVIHVRSIIYDFFHLTLMRFISILCVVLLIFKIFIEIQLL